MSYNQQNKNNSNNQTLLEFKIGPLLFCAPALEVEAIISPPAMINVPLSDDVIAGCFSYKGRTATVHSMHNKFGLPFTTQKKMTHIILSTVNDELIAFWVDLALDVSYMSNFQSVADYAPNDRKAYSDFLTRGNDIYLETSFQRLHDCNASNLQWLVDFNTDKPSVSSDTCNDAIETPEDINIGDTDKSESTTVKPLELSSNVDEPGKHLSRSTARTLPVHSNQRDKPRPELSKSVNNTRNHHFNHVTVSSQNIVPARHRHAHTYSPKPENINNTQNNNPLLPFIVAMLILMLITFASIKLLNMTDESVRSTRQLAATDISKSSKKNKIAKPHSSSTEKNTIQPKPVAIKTTAIEAISTIDTPHIKEISAENIKADNKKSMQDKTSRIFELHINEQSAPVLQKVSIDNSDSNQQDATQQIKRFTHVVVKGDTLWHITQRYLDNPHRYPELAKASDINNPHRIYPGDIIRIIVTKASTE